MSKVVIVTGIWYDADFGFLYRTFGFLLISDFCTWFRIFLYDYSQFSDPDGIIEFHYPHKTALPTST